MRSRAQGAARANDDSQLSEFLGGIDHSIDLVSAYIVLGKQGEMLFEDLARSGKRVRILTNAMNTTDVLVVHAGYTKYRRDLLEAGVKLFELKLRAEQDPGRDELKPLGLSARRFTPRLLRSTISASLSARSTSIAARRF